MNLGENGNSNWRDIAVNRVVSATWALARDLGEDLFGGIACLLCFFVFFHRKSGQN